MPILTPQQTAALMRMQNGRSYGERVKALEAAAQIGQEHIMKRQEQDRQSDEAMKHAKLKKEEEGD